LSDDSPWRERFERERKARKQAEALLDEKSRELYEANSNLRVRAEELAESLEQLRSTQETLVQREKLAALGALVAGVAHEINTPLGVALTALTHGVERLAEMRGVVDHGQPTRGILRGFIASLEEALQLVRNNLDRGASLVRNFKMVAVDQSSAELRTVDVADIVESVVSSMRPMLRNAGVEARVMVNSRIVATMSVGPFTQVLTNLLQNACIHAFDASMHERLIEVVVEDQNANMLVRVSDNGLGMSSEVKARVFDPFFTTRRGSGGTGLGMHIVQNIVVTGFGGTIKCCTPPTGGTAWVIVLPFGTAALTRVQTPS
jgi:C4-dicarboxylate-specific signal transduction histidine kinase